MSIRPSHLVSAVLLFAWAATGHTAHVVYSPIVEGGETEIEAMVDYVSDSSSPDDGTRIYYFEVAHGVNDRWMTELLIEYVDTDNSSMEAEAIEWENVFQLTEQGQYFADFGLFFELEKSLEKNSPDEIVAGLLIEKEFGEFTGLLNLLAEKEFGDNAESAVEGFGSGQLRWRCHPKFEPTLEVYSSEYNTRVGTLVNGKLAAGSNKFGYSLGMLWGADSDTPNTLRGMIEYEF
mgnify:CR=1 FL=1